MRLPERLLAIVMATVLSAFGLLVLHGMGQTQPVVSAQRVALMRPIVVPTATVVPVSRATTPPSPPKHPGTRVVVRPKTAPSAVVRSVVVVIQPNPEGWIDHRPSVTQQQVANALFDAGSPLAGSWPREDKYDFAEYIWHAGAALGIDPAVFLGFFNHESNYGLAGMATVTHSPGNLRCYSSDIPGSYCDNVNGGYEAYRTWFDGIDAMYALLWHYVHVLGLRHVDEAVPVWAPPGDGGNDDSAYIRGVLDTMQQATTL